MTRADQLLVARGLAASRAQAQRLIAGGLRWRPPAAAGLFGESGWRAVRKNNDEIPDAAEIELLDASEARYVSRGGLKLEGALAATGIDVRGRHCLDVGQSTGGFTDCLLAHGAASVTGVDVGHGQVHPRIAADARVRVYEGINARDADAMNSIALEVDFPLADGRFDLITGDLSFISLTLVLPAIVPLFGACGELVMLVKPQFELQPGQVGKGGLVRDAALYSVVERRLCDAAQALGLEVAGWHRSAIDGAGGNREFFIHARPRAASSASDGDAARLQPTAETDPNRLTP